MELLVATLARTALGNDVDGLARLRLISDTVRNAPGLVNARFYRSREPESYYFMLTTWEDEEFWYKAQDRYSPKDLFVGSAGELLMTPLLARGRNEDALLPHDASILNNNKAPVGLADKYSSNFLNLLSWPGEVQRRNFYADQSYKAISGFLSSIGIIRILELDPV